MELVFNGVLLMVLIIFFIASTNFSDVSVSSDKLGASGFPQIIIAISILLLAYITYTKIKEMKAGGEKEKFDFKDEGFKRMVLSIVLLTVYIFSMNTIGFIVGTFLFSVLVIRAMDYKESMKTIMFSLALTLAVTLIFGKVFYVSLPRGIGVLRELSYLIY